MSDFPPWGKIQGVSSKKGLFYKTTSFCDEFFISSPYMIDKSCNIKQQIYAIFFFASSHQRLPNHPVCNQG